MSRDELIARYAAGYDAVVDALGSVGLDDRPAPDEWCPRQIVHHLADAEVVRAVRLRALLTEDATHIEGWDENQYAGSLHYERPIDAALEVLRSVLALNVELVASMSDDDWKREGTHSEFGRYTMDTWVERAAEHVHEHAEQIKRCAR